ncbi:MAG TPA: glycosyltransferase [Gemmatimonadaceae bacterium]|nr:glycosyltransferase [Gemmatimonadaceae bacterium]
MTDPPTLSVVVLAYNEVDTLERTCREIIETIERIGVHAEVVVVDDGSTDGTGVVADKLAEADAQIRVIHHQPNRGLGGVYRTGFTEARGLYVTFFPADGQFPASIIGEFLPRMKDYDMVLGYLPRRDSALLSKGLSLAERALYRILLGRMPRFQGILMFRRSLLSKHTLQSQGRGWAVLLEFIIRCARDECRIVNVATDVRPRTHGSSKVNNLRTIWSNLRQVMALRQILDKRSAT